VATVGTFAGGVEKCSPVTRGKSEKQMAAGEGKKSENLNQQRPEIG